MNHILRLREFGLMNCATELFVLICPKWTKNVLIQIDLFAHWMNIYYVAAKKRKTRNINLLDLIEWQRMSQFQSAMPLNLMAQGITIVCTTGTCTYILIVIAIAIIIALYTGTTMGYVCVCACARTYKYWTILTLTLKDYYCVWH